MSVERKKLTRAGHRSSATKLLTKIDDMLKASPIDCDKLTTLKLGLNEKRSKLRTLDDEIVELIREEDLTAETEQADEYMERIHEALARMDKVLQESMFATHRGPSTGPPLEALTSSLPHATFRPSHKVKLPKISLPRFSGNPLKWSGFWDSFNSAVHNNPELSEVEKFNYLRSLLEGSAHDAIAGLMLSSTNYKEAIKILNKRFGDKQVIISKHMESLLGIEAVESDKNLPGL